MSTLKIVYDNKVILEDILAVVNSDTNWLDSPKNLYDGIYFDYMTTFGMFTANELLDSAERIINLPDFDETKLKIIIHH